MVTSSTGSVASTTVNVAVPLLSSVVVSSVADTFTPAVSSSVMVRLTSAGALTPRAFSAVADTVTCLSSASTALSIAAIVTVPVLTVSHAAMVRTVFSLKVKSEVVAGDTGSAETVTVVSSLDAGSSDAVTVADPPLSDIDALFESASVTTGVASSSVLVTDTPARSKPL